MGNISSEHGNHAAAQLLQFDAVLDMDDPLPSRDNMLKLGMGWNMTLADLHARPSPAELPPLQQMGLQAEQVLPRLRELNAVDEEVYAQARAMAAVDGAWLAEVKVLLDAERARQPGPDADELPTEPGSSLLGGAAAGSNASEQSSGVERQQPQAAGSIKGADAAAAVAGPEQGERAAGGLATEEAAKPGVLLQLRHVEQHSEMQRQQGARKEWQQVPLMHEPLLKQEPDASSRLLLAEQAEQMEIDLLQLHAPQLRKYSPQQRHEPSHGHSLSSAQLARQVLSQISKGGDTRKCGYFGAWVPKESILGMHPHVPGTAHSDADSSPGVS